MLTDVTGFPLREDALVMWAAQGSVIYPGKITKITAKQLWITYDWTDWNGQLRTRRQRISLSRCTNSRVDPNKVFRVYVVR